MSTSVTQADRDLAKNLAPASTSHSITTTSKIIWIDVRSSHVRISPGEISTHKSYTVVRTVILTWLNEELQSYCDDDHSSGGGGGGGGNTSEHRIYREIPEYRTSTLKNEDEEEKEDEGCSTEAPSKVDQMIHDQTEFDAVLARVVSKMSENKFEN